MRLLHIWHGWFLPFFLFCAAIVFSNGIHWILFRVLRRKQEEQPRRLGLGLQTHLGKPARAIFLITCLFMVQPSLPVSAGLHHDVRLTLAIAMVIPRGKLQLERQRQSDLTPTQLQTSIPTALKQKNQ